MRHFFTFGNCQLIDNEENNWMSKLSLIESLLFLNFQFMTWFHLVCVQKNYLCKSKIVKFICQNFKQEELSHTYSDWPYCWSASPSFWFVTLNWKSEIMIDDLCCKQLVSRLYKWQSTQSRQSSQLPVARFSFRLQSVIILIIRPS